MKQRRLWLFVGAVVLALSLVAVTSAAGPAGAPKPRKGGTVVFGADQEPGFLNVFLVGGNHFWGSQIVSPILAPAFKVHPDFVFRPYVITRTKVTNRPFSITYYIKKNARWYEPGGGTRPLTADDFIFHYRTVMNPQVKIGSVTGYEDISRVQRINAKTVKFTFKKPYAGYKTMFAGVFPRHALQGLDFNNVWRNSIDNPKTGRPITSGAFYLESWQKGRQAVLRRNPQFWGQKSYLDRAVYRFLPDTNTTAQQIRGGEVDVIYPQPQAFLVSLRDERNLQFVVGKGPVWEHIDFNMGHRGKGDANLRKKFVRQAISYGINRAALTNALFTANRVAPGNPVLQSVIFVSNSKFYKRHWSKYNYNPTRARQLLDRNGCSRGGDGIYRCGGQKLSFRFAWTAGNQRRALAFEIMQAQLKQVGIELVAQPVPASVIFARTRPDGDYDIIIFAWVGSPDVSSWVDVYGCRDDAKNIAQDNDQGFCYPRVHRNLDRAKSETDDAKQAALINSAAAALAEEAVTVPLYQLPTYLIYKKSFRGLRENPTSEGPVWNIEFWHRTTA